MIHTRKHITYSHTQHVNVCGYAHKPTAESVAEQWKEVKSKSFNRTRRPAVAQFN